MSKRGHADTALIIFVKQPIPGQVKTRLAATLGDDAAVAIYQQLIAHTRSVTNAFFGRRYVFYHHEVPAEDLWTGTGTTRHQQQGGDLGARMQHALSQVLTQHDQALIIGSDCGELTAAHLQAATEALRWTDVVVGPARDGGYYLLGMKQTAPALFSDMPWSTADVLPTTLDRLHEQRLNFKLLEQLSDVDTEDDWRRLGWGQSEEE
ncbi:MAG: TIGR04282 family arsenosugar biosynthesis glycosyltransferase [Saprospiraceae bacterium]|nr:TIGR04282 family arsenosugar biosynthesis glycosyltransferase [Saprospiraceae bacterium]